jgi:hypothetical protein
VAVGIRFGNEIGADHAGRCGPVVDYDRLTELFRKLRRHVTRGDVGAAAGRERHDEPDRFRGISLRQDGTRGRRCHGRDDCKKRLPFFHVLSGLCEPRHCNVRRVDNRPAMTQFACVLPRRLR